jgi:hypothetical protein
MVDPLLVWTAGVAVIAGITTPVAFYLGLRRGKEQAGPRDVDATTLTFEEVCHATARAKEDRRQEEHLSRDYVDGADGVLAELLSELEDVSGEEMQAAYLAGGEEVELQR